MEQKTIALVAHDNKKLEMAEWANYNKDFLKEFHLIGTQGTAKSIHNITGLNIDVAGHGPDGGDIVIAYEVLNHRVDYLFFFIDVRTPHGHEHDIQTLIRTCVLNEIPIALNRTTGDLMISSLLMRECEGKTK
jgi:methylglyoxal synthase